MIKVKGYIILISLLLILSGCAKGPSLDTKIITNQEDSNRKDIKAISFEYFFRGFITLKENQLKAYPHGTFIIQNAEDWGDFMNKYLPGILYESLPNFSKESLVFNVLFPAKPNYSISKDIKTFIATDSNLEPVYIDVSGIPNGIYAQNANGVIHAFVNLVKIEKKDIPKDVMNIYHKGDILANN
ncbi:hypothetical protein [Desulfosporosinus acidiphilus]|uniref:hypothetical protein n=1 Tax=Desulfosporosinus acidiphilus TaxID=885581 RepID=UPI000257A7E1|nr:hypothetical protein [Desulfosporosinus acidiphilus]